MTLDATLLRYLADEEFCSRFEVEEFVRLQGAQAETATRLLEEWEAQGWVEIVAQGDPHLPPLLRLTDAAFAARPCLRRAT